MVSAQTYFIFLTSQHKKELIWPKRVDLIRTERKLKEEEDEEEESQDESVQKDSWRNRHLFLSVIELDRTSRNQGPEFRVALLKQELATPASVGGRKANIKSDGDGSDDDDYLKAQPSSCSWMILNAIHSCG